ncbi:MAG: thiol:disulfide interchange protein DsbA/DsbL [Pseudomonadota bacterium]
MKQTQTLLFALTALLVSGLTHAESMDRFKSGEDYVPISPAAETQAPEGEVEVVEFFWYGCPHCYQFEPKLNEWVENKPDNVSFRRVPAIFNQNWAIHAKAYFAADMLGITDQVHDAIFEAIHKDNKRLNSADSLAAFMAEKSGVAEEKILKTINSFAVETRSRKAVQEVREHGLRGVPALSVAGKHHTSGRYAGSNEKMIQVLDFLIAKESAE